MDAWCREYIGGYHFAAAIGTLAYAEEYLYIETQCRVLAYALAKTFWCVQATGIVNIDVMGQRFGGVEAGLSLQLLTATMSLAMAKTRAIADTYATGEAYGFTSLVEFCKGAGKYSLLCAVSTTEVEVVAEADAYAFGDAFAAAGSGGITYNRARVCASSDEIDKIGAILVSYAMNWSFAKASAAAHAMAESYIGIYNKSFNKLCLETYKKKCGKPKWLGRPVCAVPAQKACDAAIALGGAGGYAFADAWAAAYAKAIAGTKISLVVSAHIFKVGDDFNLCFGEDRQDVGEAAAVTICPAYVPLAEDM